jgi:hypothetical protein
MTPERIDDPRDPTTFVVRFICGSLLAVLFGFTLWIQVVPDASPLAAAAVVLRGTILCGLLAVELGDRFWTEWVPNLWWW